MDLFSFHNTTNLPPAEVEERELKAQSQDEKVLEFLKEFKRPAGATLIWQAAFTPMTPITSVRRALSNLQRKNLVKKSNLKTIGMYGHKEFCYSI